MSASFPAAAERYEGFRHRIWSQAGSVVRGVERPFRDEIDLQAQWFGGEFGRFFTGSEGEKIEIVQFGHWNRGAGPDFTEVAVRLDGELRRGTLEVDVDVRDWERHGHIANREFNEVVLHVFTDQPAMNRIFTRTEDNRNIPQLLLPQYSGLEGRPDFLPEAFPGRCVAPLSRMADGEVESLLTAAAQYRLRRKSERLRVMTESTSGEQAMFQALAEALGFRQNKTAMAILAQRCPVNLLLGMDKMEREAYLFGAAGFLSSGGCEAPAGEDSRVYQRSLWDRWWKIRDSVETAPRRAIAWRFHGTRPHNHPQRRVGALAGLLEQWGQLRPLWEKNVNNREKYVNKLLKSLSHPFWEHHYTLASGTAPSARRLVGRDRLRDILGNVIFPNAVRLHPENWREYAEMGRVDSNQKLRRASLRLFGRDEMRQKLFTRYYHQQQGLLQIYDDFCLEDASECRDCPFPEQLAQWRDQTPTTLVGSAG